MKTDTHVPGAFRPRGIRNKGRGRGISAASRARDEGKWIVQYAPRIRIAARLKLRSLGAESPRALRELLERAAYERFEPYRRERTLGNV